MRFRDEELLLFDGACGSNLDVIVGERPCEDRLAGCNEYLNLCAPSAVTALHRSFYEAGAMVVETNTFGANRIVLAEYGIEDRVDEINRAAVACAREAAGDAARRYVAGSVGPGTKLPTLSHIDSAKLLDVYAEQCRALVDAGVDALIVETCQDPLQVRLALMAAFDAAGTGPDDTPVMLSVTVEAAGTMLLGTSVEALMATVAPFSLFSLGLNCATGPAQMRQHVRLLTRRWPGRVSVIPNAGMPRVRGGKTEYDLTEDEFSTILSGFVRDEGVSVVGGCCGTTPAHIRALASSLEDVRPSRRAAEPVDALSSLFDAVEVPQEIPPVLIGERMNTHGSRRFKKRLLAEDFEAAAAIGLKQEKEGAHLLDLCVAYAGRDEAKDIASMLKILRATTRAPIVIDSTRPQVIEAALMEAPGRCLINSVNLEDGGKTAREVLTLAKRHGAAVIALTIDEDGMAMTAAKKLAVSRRIHALAVDELGMRPGDIFFDALTFTLGSGDENLTRSAVETEEAIALIKEALPGVRTSLGVSNVSFGLPAHARPLLNSAFLHRTIRAGLDAAIVDAAKIVPMSDITEEDRRVCDDLLNGAPSSLAGFLEHFAEERKTETKEETDATPPEDRLSDMILHGEREGLEDIVDILLATYSPLQILNVMMIPAMRKVGVLFGRGEMLLPFVLQSAEAMKAGVKHLEPHMDAQSAGAGPRILLATVAGDVHDIGKNLVDIILSNNGYRVENIGTNVPAATIIEKAKTLKVDAIGLSGLLVKSALHMRETLPAYWEAGLDVPILLGGAALTTEFVANECVPAYKGRVVYCADAFDGLSALRPLEDGTLESTRVEVNDKSAPGGSELPSDVSRNNPVPTAPFLGRRVSTDIPVQELFPLLNRRALFRGRWGYRRGKGTKEELAALIAEVAEPALDELFKLCLEENLAKPAAVYGYYPCEADGETLIIRPQDAAPVELTFPRQGFPPNRCLTDYFKTAEEGGDLAGLFVATVGNGLLERAQSLFEADQYKDYLSTHGFAMELADALAEHTHRTMKAELGLVPGKSLDNTPAPGGTGLRYGFGYSSCPDLDAQKAVFSLLRPEEIGVTLTDRMQMVPESTTSAIVVHHPDATYFSV